MVCKSHGEIIRVSGVGEPLQLVYVRAQIVRTVHLAVFDFRDSAVVTAMHTEVVVAVAQQFFEPFVVLSPERVLRIVVAFSVGLLDEVNGIGVRHAFVLLNQPWEGVKRVVVYLAQGSPYLLRLASEDAPDSAGNADNGEGGEDA